MKKVLIITLSILAVLSLAGCDNKKKEENNLKNNNQQEENKNENIEIVVGKKEYPIKLNGKTRNVRVEYKTDIQDDDSLNCDIYLDDTKITSMTRVVLYYDTKAFEFLSRSEILSSVKENPNYNFEFFKDDFKVYSVKGKDNKDYLAILIPRYNEGPINYSILIANDSGKLIQELFADNSMLLKLTGADSKNYDNPLHSGWSNYFYIGSDKIYYIIPDNCRDDGVVYYVSTDYNAKETMIEYALTINNDKLAIEKTGATYIGTDFEGATPGGFVTFIDEQGKYHLLYKLEDDNKKITIKNPGCVIGKDEYPIKINGKNRTLKVEYYNYDKKEYIEPDDYIDDWEDYFYITYKFYIDDVVIDGLKAYDGKIYVYDDIEKLKDADGTTNFIKEHLELETAILKGNDKEYLIILAGPLGDAPEKDIIIASDTTGLLGELYMDEECGVILSDKNVNKKYNPNEYTSITESYYINNDKIEYLKPTSNMYNKDGLVDCSSESITFDEYVITIKDGKLLNTKTKNQYKSTYCEGATHSRFTMFYAK